MVASLVLLISNAASYVLFIKGTLTWSYGCPTFIIQIADYGLLNEITAVSTVLCVILKWLKIVLHSSIIFIKLLCTYNLVDIKQNTIATLVFFSVCYRLSSTLIALQVQ